MRRALLVAGCLLPARAHASPARHLDLHWQATEGCIDRTLVERTVQRTLGRAVFDTAGPAAATIDGEVTPTTGGFQAVIRLRSPRGAVLSERTLTTDGRCERMDESVAVVVALMVDGVEEPESEPEPLPTTLVVPVTPPREANEVVSDRVEEAPRMAVRHTGFEAELGLALAAGLVPRTTGGAFVKLGFVGSVWAVELRLSGWSPGYATAGSVDARVAAFTAGGALCWVSGVTWRVFVCANAGGGATSAQPHGLVDTVTTALPLAFAGGEVGLSLAVAHLRVDGRVGAWGILLQPHYFFHESAGPTSLFTAWPVVPFLSLGLGWGS